MNGNKQVLVVIFMGLAALSLLSCANRPEDIPAIKNGVLDLRSWDHETEPVFILDGKWELYGHKLLNDSEIAEYLKSGGSYITTEVKKQWNDEIIDGRVMGGYNYATYHFEIIKNPEVDNVSIAINGIGTAFSLFKDDKKIASSGNVGKSRDEMIPRVQPATAAITLENERTDIIIWASNFYDRNGGIWYEIQFGKQEKVFEVLSTQTAINVFTIGVLFIMGIYHLGLFVLRRKDHSSLFFGLFCLLICLRTGITGPKFFLTIMEPVSWQIMIKLEYLTVFLSAPLFLYFIDTIYHKYVFPLIPEIVLILSLACTFLTIVTPLYIYSYALTPYLLMALGVSIYILYILIRSILRKEEGTIILLIGMIVFSGSLVNDFLYTEYIIDTGFWLPYGLVFFIFSQAFLLALRFSKAFFNVEQLSQNLSDTNKAYSRFVPIEFLHFLNKESITEVKLGDQTEKSLTILFSDIRAFTSLSEAMSPQENFTFLNSYLAVMEPVIREQHGFIDKYIGDAIMALFPESVENAVHAAIDMKLSLIRFNQRRLRYNQEPIDIGIGLHTGDAMLGTIGNIDRMDSTVIADSVNLASRLEDLTKVYGSSIIISQDCYRAIQNDPYFQTRKIGHVKVRGKKKSTEIYEIINAEKESFKKLVVEYMEEFDKALNLFLKKEFARAGAIFKALYEENPNDYIVWNYLKRIKNMQDPDPVIHG